MSDPKPTNEISAVVSGSFKFKPEIDRTIEELQDHRVVVLGPDQGWLYLPKQRLWTPGDGSFRPLPTERGQSALQIETEFLSELRASDFLYLYNQEQYIGDMVSFELGYALALDKPIYALETIKVEDPIARASEIEKLLIDRAVILPPGRAAEHFNSSRSE